MFKLVHERQVLSEKEKVADLLFDLVKYLLTTIGAIVLLSEKAIKPVAVVTIVGIAAVILVVAIRITPLKED